MQNQPVVVEVVQHFKMSVKEEEIKKFQSSVKMTRHDTPMLDELENGPWPSFISGIKRLRDEHPEPRINKMTNDLLGQLEHSYETRKLFWIAYDRILKI